MKWTIYSIIKEIDVTSKLKADKYTKPVFI